MNHNSPEIPHKAQAEDPTQHRNCFIYHSDATDAEYDLNLAQRFVSQHSLCDFKYAAHRG